MGNIVDRRVARYFAGAIKGLNFATMPEHRQVSKVKWKAGTLLKGCVLGLAAGRLGFSGMESLTQNLSAAVRQEVGLPKRLPDTTVRDYLTGASVSGLQDLLTGQAKSAHRRKSLEALVGKMPIRMLAVDGKYDRAFVTLRKGESLADLLKRAREQYPYFQPDETLRGKRLYGEVRTLSVCVVGIAQAVYLDCVPVDGTTNEQGTFPEALARIVKEWKNCWDLELISVDAGTGYLNSATLVNEANLGYLMAIKDSQPTLLAELCRLTASASCDYEYTERYRGNDVTFRIWRTQEIAGWDGWSHLRQGIRIQRETRDQHGQFISKEDRYYVSNVLWNRLSSEQWAQVIRSHWCVENNAHRTLDVPMKEGPEPWTQEPHAMLAMVILRRVVFNMLALLKSVYLRSEESRALPWRELIARLYDLLRLASPDDLVRPRKQVSRIAG